MGLITKSVPSTNNLSLLNFSHFRHSLMTNSVMSSSPISCINLLCDLKSTLTSFCLRNTDRERERDESTAPSTL